MTNRRYHSLPLLAALILVASMVPQKSVADVLTFQQGVGGYTGLSQTTLFQLGAAADQVNGGLAAGTWTVDGGNGAFNDGQFKQALIRFDNIFGAGPGQIPLGSTITSATITANYDDPSGSSFAVYRMLQTWSPSTATWTSFTNGVQNDGTEAAVAATTTFSIPNSNAAGVYNAYGTSLTADLALFSNGTSNFGWVVLPTSGNSGWGWTAAQTNTPVLSVTFTPPSGGGPSVTLGLTGSPMAEAAGAATVTATLSATSASPVTVNLAYTGTATLTTDYTASANSIVIAPGNLTGTATLTAVQDSLYENPNETIIVDISTVTNGTESGTQQVTATIADDDPVPPTVTLALTGSPMAEAAGVATVTATLSGTSLNSVTVNLAYSGTATPTTDYTASANSIVIAPGNLTGTATLTAVQDSLYENPDETIIVDISTVTNGTESGVQQVTATIANDDPVSNILLSQNFSSDPVNYTLPLNSDFRFDTTPRYWAKSDTPTLIVNAGITGANGIYLGTQNLDSIADRPFSSSAPAQIDFTLAASAYTNLRLSIALAGMPMAEDVNFIRAKTDTNGDGTYETTLFEFKGLSNSAYTDTVLGALTAAFQTFSNIALPAPTHPDGMLRLRLESYNDTDSQNEATGIDTIVITGDPVGPPSVTLALTGSPMAEAAGAATVTATLSATSASAVTVNLAYSGTATLTDDYTRSGTSIVIPAGSTTGTVTLTAVQDLIDENPNETIVVDISSVTNGTESGVQQVTATITDDDPPPAATLALADSPMTEAAGAATVTASLSGTSSTTVTVNLAFSGTATLTDDYTRTGTSIVIPAGSTSGTVTLTAVQDSIYETPDETIMVDIDTVTNGTESGSQQVTAAIANDDPVPPSVTLALSGSPMAEAAGEATVTATLSETSASAVTVNLAFSGTATLSDDYTRSGTSIVIAAGDTTGTVTLTAVQDSLYENPDETVIVDIDTVTNGIENTPQQVTATITDDDPAPPTVTLALTGSPMAEAAGEAMVTATLSATSASTVTVNLAYSGTAVLTDDYTRTGTTIVIAAGDTTGTVTLTAVQDSLYENPDETIVVDISSVTNAAESGVQQVTATITDDDPAPPTVTLALTGSPMAEAAGVATVTATLSTGITYPNPVTVNLAFAGTATVTDDYTRSGTTIVIPANTESGTVTLTAVQDSLYENPDETIIVDISSVVDGTESGSQQVTATITDDDPAPSTVTLAVTGSAMAEAAGVATVTATLSATSANPVTVNLAFSGTATLTTDYTRSGTSIVIPPGSPNGTITLTAVQDSLYENPDETIIVDISSVVNGTESGSQQVTASIVSDDYATVEYEAFSNGAVNTNSVLAWSHTVGGLAGRSDRMLVVGVSTERGSTSAHCSANTVTFGSQSMTRVPGSAVNSSLVSTTTSFVGTELWYLPNPTVGTATITVTFADSQTGGIMGGAMSFAGVKQSAPIAVAVTADPITVTTSYPLNITTPADGAVLVDIGSSGSSANDFTASPPPPMNRTWTQKLVNSASMSQGGAYRIVPTAGTVTDTWTIGTASRNSHAIAAFVPAGPTIPPTVALTAPTEGATVFVPGTTALAATANDTDGTVSKVEFFDGATKLGEDLNAPYNFVWTPVGLGAHSLTAKATDNGGNTTTSTAVNVTAVVNPNQPPVITLTAPANLATITGSSTTLSANIIDPEGDAQTVTFYGRQTAPVTPGPDFTFVAIPDTQFYSEDTGRNAGAPSNSGAHISYFNDQTQWITNNRVTNNIAFVAHMGDMVQNGDSIDAEWVRASGAMGLIENPLTTLLTHGIPWGGAPGNHDFGTGGGTGTTTKWNQYFGTDRWNGRTYFRGNYGSDNNNNYQFFSAGGLDFIVINIAYRTTADTAVHDWADALLKAYPNRRAIVTSHWIVNTGNPATFGGQGQALYDNLKDNPNLFMMLCGHVHGEGRRTDTFQSRDVHSILQDYQDSANGGNGFLRTFTFSPANNQITAKMYSPTLNREATTTDVPTALGTFTLPYNMQGAITDWIPLGTVNVPANGTTASLDWTGLEHSKDYEWYATANDSVSTASSTTRRFTTAPAVPPTVSITAPANSSTYYAPATVNIAATANDPDGSVTKVEFFRGATKLGEDTTAPYEYTATGQTAGNYTLTAVATDNQNNTTTSAGISITVSVAPSSGTLSREPYLNQNNQNSIVVRWRSSQSIVGRVRYGDSPTNLTNFTDEAAAATNHVVKLTGLAPYTRYYYSVGSAFDTLAGGDANHTFRTSPVPGTATDTRIWVVGDCGRGNQFQRDVRDAYYAWTGARTPDLCLMLGDNAYNTGTDAEYKTGFFDIYPTTFRKMPLWSTLGNHDANIDSATGTTPYFDMFTFPTQGECGGVLSSTEYYYSFDYGNIHFVNLDSQISSRAVDNPLTTGINENEDGPMAAWLRLDLASTTKTWIVVMFHHPPYSKGSHNSDTEGQLIEMRAKFGPILEAGGVDAVLCGHSHAYERSKLIDDFYETPTLSGSGIFKNAGDGRPTGNGAYIKPLTGPRDHFGAVYAVAGSAGSADGGSLNHPVMYVSYNTGGTLNLDINGNRLDATYIQKGVTNGTFTTPDTFTIIKQGAADSDSDGIPDAYELAHGLNRFNPADAALDSDGDGTSNLDEFVFDTAANASDKYAFSTTYNNDGTVTVSFPTIVGRSYRVNYSNTLLGWLPGSAPVAGTGATMTWTDDGTSTGSPPSNTARRFYQVEVTVTP